MTSSDECPKSRSAARLKRSIRPWASMTMMPSTAESTIDRSIASLSVRPRSDEPIVVGVSLPRNRRLLACPAASDGAQRVGMQRHLQHTIALVAEEIKRLLDFVEREFVRHERPQVNPPMLDHRHEPPHSFFSARAQGCDDRLIAEAGIDRFVRRNQLSRVDAKARHCSSGPSRPQAALEGFLPAERFDGYVDPASAGEPLDRLDDILFAWIQRDIGAEPPRHLEPFAVRI